MINCLWMDFISRNKSEFRKSGGFTLENGADMLYPPSNMDSYQC